jgi:hypothetical protein
MLQISGKNRVLSMRRGGSDLALRGGLMKVPLCFALLLLTVTGCVIENKSSGGSVDATPTSVPGGGSEVNAVEQVASLPGEATVGITSDGTYAYVTTLQGSSGAGRVLRVGDGNVVALASGVNRAWAIDHDDKFVYYSHQDGVSRVAIAGGEAPVNLTAGKNTATGIALGLDYVYFACTDGIHRVSKSGGDDTLWVPDSDGADAVVVDSYWAYWIDRGTAGSSNAGAVRKADFATGHVSTLADGLSLTANTTFALAQDDNSIYFPDAAKSIVYGINKDSGAVSTITTAAQSPVSLAVAGTAVIIAAEGTSGGGNRAIDGVHTLNDDGTVAVIADAAQTGLYALAVDTQYIWFTNYVTTGGVYRVALPLWTSPGGGGGSL